MGVVLAFRHLQMSGSRGPACRQRANERRALARLHFNSPIFDGVAPFPCCPEHVCDAPNRIAAAICKLRKRCNPTVKPSRPLSFLAVVATRLRVHIRQSWAAAFSKRPHGFDTGDIRGHPLTRVAPRSKTTSNLNARQATTHLFTTSDFFSIFGT
jgi:hypothetical protein